MHLHVMATKSLIVVNKVVLSDQEEHVMLDVRGEVVFLREVPEDDYVEDGTKERDNHFFCPNIDAMKKQEQLHPEKINLEVLHIRQFFIL